MPINISFYNQNNTRKNLIGLLIFTILCPKVFNLKHYRGYLIYIIVKTPLRYKQMKVLLDAEHSHTVKCKFTFILFYSISKFPLASIFCNNFQRVILYVLLFYVRFQGRYIKQLIKDTKHCKVKYIKNNGLNLLSFCCNYLLSKTNAHLGVKGMLLGISKGNSVGANGH